MSMDFVRKELVLSAGRPLGYFSLPELEKAGWGPISRLPYAVRIILESLLRNQGHPAYTEGQVAALARWAPGLPADAEFPFLPARVLFQDFTGVPCVVDLAAMREVMARAGKDPGRIEPLIPVDLVIDHSVQMDAVGNADALRINMEQEFARNAERYAFLRWGQGAFRKLNVIPPGLGICHQVNLEHLAECVRVVADSAGRPVACPDSVVGTDSHTTMINGLGVLGWGVGGIEAEAAMLGQPIPITAPVVTGVRLSGALRPGATATDLALLVTQKLRAKGVVNQFVEFCGPGLDRLTLADRATVANMAPEYGATTGLFPVDEETLRYLRQTGRPPELVDRVERYCKTQGLFREPGAPEPQYSSMIEIDLNTVEPCVAGPKRPHDWLPLAQVKPAFQKALTAPVKERGFGLAAAETGRAATVAGVGEVRHGTVVIAAITSCTNTSNPQVLLAAGLLARNAVARGLRTAPGVKTSLAPGSRVVTAYLRQTGLLADLEKLGFHVAAYGCGTCIGNSGPLDPRLESAVKDAKIVAAAVLSGNRNFEGRVHPAVKANYLCAPPLVVAYALAGRIDIDFETEPLGVDSARKPVFLRDLWPSDEAVRPLLAAAAAPEVYRQLYRDIAASNPAWNAIPARVSPVYPWDEQSTYIRNPSFVAEIAPRPAALADIHNARALACFGDFITTDHISPAGAIAKDSPAAAYLVAHGVAPADFNSYGARRGNHEVMMRGTFANIRIRNKLVDIEGGWTVSLPDGERLSIFDAAMKYRAAGTPLVVLAGKLYGAGSSRDWAAKGTYLLGVRAVLAESFERIHRSNLVEMGVLPLEFIDGQTAEGLGLTGREVYSITGIASDLKPGKLLDVRADATDQVIVFKAKCRIDSSIEVEYYRHGGIIPFVLRGMM